ncbi:MAG: hypothetical protein ACYS8Z_22310 [Planctomycetota bacterium]
MNEKIPPFVERDKQHPDTPHFILAYCNVRATRSQEPREIAQFQLVLIPDDDDLEGDFCVCALNPDGDVVESKGSLYSVAEAFLIAREQWNVPVRYWHVHPKPNFSDDSIAILEKRYRLAERRAAELIWRCQSATRLVTEVVGDDPDLKHILDVMEERGDEDGWITHIEDLPY